MSVYRTAKQTGDLMGVSVKALRLYEARGLISPVRTEAGWRVYGPEDLEQLQKIKALKSIGLSLEKIGSLLKRGLPVRDVLAAQREVLTEQRDFLGRAILIVAKAEAKLADGQSLSPDDLIKLAKETDMSDYEWTEAHQKLAERHYTKEQLDWFAERKISSEFQADIDATWTDILAEAERLRSGPADTPEAIAFARRWTAAASMFSDGDPSVDAATANWYEDGFSNPETAKLMPFSKEVWEFANAAIAAMNEQDGIV